MSCQACSAGYSLLNSFCWIIPSSPSSSSSASKTQATATQTVSSAISAVGSVASVGTSVFHIVGLVSEAVQNTRYLNLSVSDELAEVYQTFSTNMISWDLPNFMESLDDYNQLPDLFAQYDLDSPFLVNFWSTMMTIGLALCILIFCFGVRKFFFERSGKLGGGLAHSLVKKIIGGSINFVVVQAYGSLDNILFYFVLDVRTNPLNSAFSRASLASGILLIVCGSLLMIFGIKVVKKYHVLKNEKDTKELEMYHEKNKYLEVFYGDFSDADLWSHCFMAFLVLRSNVSSLILTLLYEYPLIQTIFFIILDGAILLFMLIEKPFTTPRAVFFQYYFETIVLIVHICCLILGWANEPSEGLKKSVCTAIIYLNTALVTGGFGFMFIDIHETVCEKPNKWKLKKAQEKGAVVFPLPEESDTSLQSESPGIETRSPQKTNHIAGRENSVDSSSFHFESRPNYLENNRSQTSQARSKPRNRFANKDLIYPNYQNDPNILVP